MYNFEIEKILIEYKHFQVMNEIKEIIEYKLDSSYFTDDDEITTKVWSSRLVNKKKNKYTRYYTSPAATDGFEYFTGYYIQPEEPTESYYSLVLTLLGF